MTKQEFDAVFSKCSDKLKMKDPKDISKALKGYLLEEKETITAFEMASFAYLEAIKYADNLIYTVLLEVLDIE